MTLIPSTLIFLLLCLLPTLIPQALAQTSRTAIFIQSIQKRHLKEAVDAHVFLWETLQKYRVSPDKEIKACIHELMALKDAPHPQDLQKAYRGLEKCNKAFKKLLKAHKKVLKAQDRGLFACFKRMVKEAAFLIEQGKASLNTPYISDLSL